MSDHESRIPPPPGEDEIDIHSRTYAVNAYRVSSDQMRLRGRVTDTKPAGLYVRNDTEPLDVHDMVVDLLISFPMLEIQEALVVLDTHPNRSCPSIEGTFGQLAGLSIARGFNRKLTELFGGPRGCTHVVALLRAMAPVAVQSIYSMEAADPDRGPGNLFDRDRLDATNREQSFTFIRDSCHVWASDGERMAAAMKGELTDAPVWIENRLTKLGRTDELSEWT